MLVDYEYRNKKLLVSYINEQGNIKLKYYTWNNPTKFIITDDDDPDRSGKFVTWDGKSVKEIKPEIYRKVNISSNTFHIVKEGLRETILNGTGWRANIKELNISGKTGTAQNPQGDTHAWFIGFIPYKESQICITVFIENGGEGSEAAAPIARAMLEKYFNIQE